MTDSELWRLYAETRDRARFAEKNALANREIGAHETEEKYLKDLRYFTDVIAALETVISADRGRAA